MDPAQLAKAPSLLQKCCLGQLRDVVRGQSRRIARHLWPADRRGAVSLIFAAAATAFFGFAALATEAGGWYLVRRNAQNAADAAARAGAVALALATPATRAARIAAAGNQLAAQNGFAEDAQTTIAV